VWLSFCIISFSLIWRSFIIQKLNFFEFFVLYLLSVLSSVLLLSSADLLATYLIVELQSICFYTLASFRRGFAYSSEAGLKYFISSAFMSCLFLLGASILYGSLGTLSYSSISLLLSLPLSASSSYLSYFVLFGSLLIVIFFLFKLTIAPFHFWFPQIYDGSPLSATILFSLLPKLIFFSVLVRLLATLGCFFNYFSYFILLCGFFSSAFGIFLALYQKKLKKLFIYSSIGQLGLPICAVSIMNFNSILYSYFFMFIYMITNILLWGYFFFSYYSQKKSNPKQEPILFITSLSDLFRFNKGWSLVILFVFFSMGGIPPFSGFVSKLWVYVVLVESHYYLLSFLLILIGSFSAFYYIKILKVTFFENSSVGVGGTNTTIFRMVFFNVDCLVYASLLFSLLFLTFFPELILSSFSIVVCGLFN
jgi:proton-translocating NADH-quinone oxidoreductase chain N